MDEICDEVLVEKLRKTGELRYFDQLVSRHIGKVRGMIYPMVLNHADADDLTQETFVRVMRHIGGFRRRARFSTWLYRIAINTTKTFLAKRSRGRMEYHADPPEPPSPAPARYDGISATEDDRRIDAALAALSPSLRSAITLTVLQGLDVRKAAAIDGCLAQTMYWRVFEARRQLRKSLGKH